MLANGSRAARCSLIYRHVIARQRLPSIRTPIQNKPLLHNQFRITTPRRLQSTASEARIPPNNIPPPSEPEAPPPRRPIPVRVLAFLAIAIVSSSVGFVMSAYPSIQTAQELLTPPTDEETLLLFNPSPEDPAFAINEHILSHNLTRSLEANEKYYPSRPHLKLPPSLRNHNFTGGTLSGGDKISVPPLIFATLDGSSLVSIQYLGSALCGHPGIVHGGLLATLLDEGLARCCFPALPHKVGVTASLKIDYRRPCMAGQYVVLKAETTKVDGRKAWVKGRLETLPDEGSGEVLVEAEALFIEPKGAKAMARIYAT